MVGNPEVGHKRAFGKGARPVSSALSMIRNQSLGRPQLSSFNKGVTVRMPLPPPDSLERARRFSGNARIVAFSRSPGHSYAASGEPIGRVLPGFSPEPLMAVRFRKSLTGQNVFHYNFQI